MFRDPVSPEVVEPYQFVFDSPQVRASLELADYARESFGKDTPLLAGRAGFDAPHFQGFQIRPAPPPSRRRWKKFGKNGAASARISRIWASRACARSACPRATSAAICARARRRASRVWSARMRATRGSDFLSRHRLGGF
jgi:hypothetical protein